MGIEHDIDLVNEAYMAEDYDLYESRLERFAAKHGKTVGRFEDDCTDARLYGHGIN